MRVTRTALAIGAGYTAFGLPSPPASPPCRQLGRLSRIWCDISPNPQCVCRPSHRLCCNCFGCVVVPSAPADVAACGGLRRFSIRAQQQGNILHDVVLHEHSGGLSNLVQPYHRHDSQISSQRDLSCPGFFKMQAPVTVSSHSLSIVQLQVFDDTVAVCLWWRNTTRWLSPRRRSSLTPADDDRRMGKAPARN